MQQFSSLSSIARLYRSYKSNGTRPKKCNKRQTQNIVVRFMRLSSATSRQCFRLSGKGTSFSNSGLLHVNQISSPTGLAVAFGNDHVGSKFDHVKCSTTLTGEAKAKQHPAKTPSWDEQPLQRFPSVIKSLQRTAGHQNASDASSKLVEMQHTDTDVSAGQVGRKSLPFNQRIPTPSNLGDGGVDNRIDSSIATKPEQKDQFFHQNSIPDVVESQRTQHTTKATKRKPERTASILKEVFAAQVQTSNEGTQPGREAPRLGFDYLSQLEEVARRNHGKENKWDQAASERASQSTALIVVYNASKLLSEHDFHCLTPGGKHIPEWASKGRISKIVRGRDADTLERNGDYYLIFDMVSAAQAYIHHVKAVHTLAEVYKRDSTRGKVPPVADANLGYSSPAYLLQSYTIFPPGPFRMALEVPPYGPLRRRIVEDLGYPQLVGERLSDYEVLVTLRSDFKCSLKQMTQAVMLNERDLGISWGFAAGMPIRHVLRDTWKAAGADHGADGLEGVEDSAVSGKSTMGNLIGDREDNQFVLSFEDETEAQRFIATWHGRDMAHLFNDSALSGGLPVRAEFTW